MIYAFCAGIPIALDFNCTGITRCFFDFKSDNYESPKLIYSIKVGVPDKITSNKIVDTDEFHVTFTDYGYICSLKDSAFVNGISVRENGGVIRATIFVSQVTDESEFADEVFDVMKFAFYTALQKEGIIVLHAASVVYRDKVVLFSANSGTGKSTHVNLWRQELGVPVFNGDVTVVGFEGEKPVCYAIPWSGSSGQYETKDRPLGAICFLRRGDANTCEEPDPLDCVLLIARHCFTNNLTRDGMEKNLSCAEKISEHTPIFILNALPEKEAVLTAKNYLDRIMKSEI